MYKGEKYRVNEFEVTTFINTLSVMIAKELDENELIFVAAVQTQIVSALETIAVIKYSEK